MKVQTQTLWRDEPPELRRLNFVSKLTSLASLALIVFGMLATDHLISRQYRDLISVLALVVGIPPLFFDFRTRLLRKLATSLGLRRAWRSSMEVQVDGILIARDEGLLFFEAGLLRFEGMVGCFRLSFSDPLLSIVEYPLNPLTFSCQLPNGQVMKIINDYKSFTGDSSESFLDSFNQWRNVEASGASALLPPTLPQRQFSPEYRKGRKTILIAVMSGSGALALLVAYFPGSPWKHYQSLLTIPIYTMVGAAFILWIDSTMQQGHTTKKR